MLSVTFTSTTSLVRDKGIWIYKTVEINGVQANEWHIACLSVLQKTFSNQWSKLHDLGYFLQNITKIWQIFSFSVVLPTFHWPDDLQATVFWGEDCFGFSIIQFQISSLKSYCSYFLISCREKYQKRWAKYELGFNQIGIIGFRPIYMYIPIQSIPKLKPVSSNTPLSYWPNK